LWLNRLLHLLRLGFVVASAAAIAFDRLRLWWLHRLAAAAMALLRCIGFYGCIGCCCCYGV
jgi:hypothetical protein